jgi:SAM-dependent methyltransferase
MSPFQFLHKTKNITKKELLNDINCDIPPGVDWRAGAQSYLQKCFSNADSRESVELYSLIKPFAYVLPGMDTLPELIWYFSNFVNLIHLLRPLPGSRFLDVACGGGWLSHFLSKMKYETIGIDVSSDFIALAMRRMLSDPHLGLPVDKVEKMFFVHDVESEPLGEAYLKSFDFAILESCLHHFYDPISALINITEALKPDGVAVIMEGENREGPIKPDYLRIMHEFHTMERPYTRQQLEALMIMAGLPHFEFLGRINGWWSPRDPAIPHLGDHVLQSANASNLVVATKSPERLAMLFPFRANEG